MDHIGDHDLERYHLGLVADETELSRIEEHLLWCAECVTLAEQAADYVDAIRAAIILGNWDLNSFNKPLAAGIARVRGAKALASGQGTGSPRDRPSS